MAGKTMEEGEKNELSLRWDIFKYPISDLTHFFNSFFVQQTVKTVCWTCPLLEQATTLYYNWLMIKQ